jgi:HK97 family phage prohead protease
MTNNARTAGAKSVQTSGSTKPYASSGNNGEGIITMYVAMFDAFEPDAAGDIIHPDAFDSWYKRFSGRKDAVLSIVWSHQWQDADACIGFARAEDIVIDGKGLLVSAHVDLSNPLALQVWKQCRTGAIDNASFSYDTLRQRKGTSRSGKACNVLEALDLLECGPTLFGAEPTTSVVSTKALKANRARAKSIENTVYKGAVERLVKYANRRNRPVTPALAEEARKYDVPLSLVDEMEGLFKSLPKCSRCGRFLQAARVQAPDTTPASQCGSCGQWMVWIPGSVPTYVEKRYADAVVAKIRRWKAGAAKREQLKAQIQLDEWEQDRIDRKAQQERARRELKEWSA